MVLVSAKVATVLACLRMIGSFGAAWRARQLVDGAQNRPVALLRTWPIALALTLATIALLPTSVGAQSYPSDCRAAGGNNVCVASWLSPRLYTDVNRVNVCTSTPPHFASDSAAIADWMANGAPSVACSPNVQDEGYYTSSPLQSYGCGASAAAPMRDSAGREFFNLHRMKLTSTICNSNPPQQLEQHINAVVMQRVQICPTGYITRGVFCKRSSGQIDPVRHLGGACPTCGNPISLTSGNKYQEETDYQGVGIFPLMIKRYYNSAMEVTNTVPGGNSHYGTGVVGTNTGNQTIASLVGGAGYLAQLPLLTDDAHYRNLALGVIGDKWRHHYQRSLTIRSLDDSQAGLSLTSAAAYRHDGRVYIFNLYNNQWVGEKDVNLSLTTITGGYRLVDEQDNAEIYDTGGRLLSISNRAGIEQALSYDSCGRLSTVTHSFGAQLLFNYDTACGQSSASALIASITLPAGSQVGYSYSSGKLTSVSYPNSTTRGYQYSGSLTGIVDENSVLYASWGYDSLGRATTSQHADGADATSVAYTCTSNCSTLNSWEITTAAVTDALNTVHTYSFTVVNGVSKVDQITQPAASGTGTVTESYTYDTNGNRTSERDFKNQRTCYSYDLARNLETYRVEGFAAGLSCPSNLMSYTATAGTRQRKISTQWHATFRQPIQIDEPGKRTTFTHDVNGNVLTKTVLDTSTSASRTWTYTYNTSGQVLTADGPRTDLSDVTTYTYHSCTTGYECGQVHTIESALGHVTTYNTYNAHGQPLTITGPNGVVTSLVYDLRQRLTSRTVGSETTTFDYWPAGLLKRATLPDGSYLEYTYDAAHRLTDINDAEGNRIHYTLDAMGNRIGEQAYDPSNALTRARTRVFDRLNRLQKEIGAAGTADVTTTFGYDNNGNQTSIAAPLGRTTGQTFDELNRLTQVTDPLSGVMQYGYNALDQLISATDPRSKVTSYTYNALGDLTQQVSPDTGTTTNTFDSAGNLLTSTDARSKTPTYGYDALNRVTSLTYSDQAISYTYDSGTNQKGRLTQVTDGSGSTNWTYDAQGRVLSRQQVMGVTKSVGYA